MNSTAEGTSGTFHRKDRVVIAGGSGFIGLSLATHLSDRGAAVVILSRHAPRVAGPWRHVPWDGQTVGEWARELDGAMGLVNLAGRSVDCIKTPDRQDEILRSRVEPTRLLGAAMRKVASPPRVWVQMSTAHIYGDPPDTVCREDSPFGYGLAPFVGQAWEEAFRLAVLPSQRSVVLRTSFVLGRDRGARAGAMRRLYWLARLGLGGTIGSGKQGISWIHEQDMNRLIEQSLLDASLDGPYIASAPNPVTQRAFMRELRMAVGIPVGLPTAAWMARLGARWVLRTDPDLALYGRFVVPQRLLDHGFEFVFPTVDGALGEVCANGGRRVPNEHPASSQSG